MSKVKLDKVLFEYMEGITNWNYSYLEFINDLKATLRLYGSSDLVGEFQQYFSPENREETIEKLVKAYVLGYEEESDTYMIVLFEKNGFKYVLWEVEGYYEISEENDYWESGAFKKSFTMEEIIANFPQLAYLAQKNK